MTAKTILVVAGLFHAANELFMLAAPNAWYAAVPGLPHSGPANHHFIRDIGIAFLTSGIGLALGAGKGRRAGALTLAGAAFPAAGCHRSFPARRCVMLKSLFHRQIAKFEGRFGYDAGYLHEVVDASPWAAFKFNLFQAMAQHREDVPEDAWFAAKLAGALSEDCGPCTQLCVDMAVAAGVAPHQLASLLRGDFVQADPDAALAFRYATAVARNHEVGDLVEAVRERFGERGLVSLSFAVACARVFPTLKRGLGRGLCCREIVAGDETIVVKAAA